MRKLLKVSGFVRIETKSKKPTKKIFFFMVKVTTYRHQGDFYLRFEPHSIVL